MLVGRGPGRGGAAAAGRRRRARVRGARGSSPTPAPVDAAAVDALSPTLRGADVDAALVLTSFHQSPLPLALLLRLAGVAWVGAISDDYPGSLLDLRHRLPEVPGRRARERAGAVPGPGAPASTCPGPARLAVRPPLPDVPRLVGAGPVRRLHPGADAPGPRPGAGAQPRARRARWSAPGTASSSPASPGEPDLTAFVANGLALDLAGAVDLAGLAAVLARRRGRRRAQHRTRPPRRGRRHAGRLAVRPGRPAERWAPYGVPVVLLGDQDAPCRLTRARHCPVPGHPCLDGIAARRRGRRRGELRPRPRSVDARHPTAPTRPLEVDHV